MFLKKKVEILFPVEDIIKIEFNHLYKLQVIDTYKALVHSVFYTNNKRDEIKGHRWEEISEIADQAKLNRREFFILDSDASGMPLDRVICSKAIENQVEMIFHYPETGRISSPSFIRGRAGEAMEIPLILILCILIILFGTGVKFIAILIPALVFLIYLMTPYFKYFISSKNFQKQQDYPRITVNENYFIYERYGKQRILSWIDIQALDYSWRDIVIYATDNASYPIPNYELISIFSSKLLVLKVIEYAGLIQEKPKSNRWIKFATKISDWNKVNHNGG